MNIVTFADNRAKDFFYKQDFKLLNQVQRYSFLDKIEVYKRATLMRYNTDAPISEKEPEIHTPEKNSLSSIDSEGSSSQKFGFTSQDIESESTKSSETLGNSPEDRSPKN